MGKKNEWVNKNVNLKSLAAEISSFLSKDNFSEVKLIEDPNGTSLRIQARKKGVMKTLTGRRKALHIIIEGTSNSFKVMLKGEMGKNYLYGGLVGVGLNARYQKKLWDFIKKTVSNLENSEHNANAVQSHTTIPEAELEEAIEEEDHLKILQNRLAKGEINQKEYYELLNILQSSQKQHESVEIKQEVSDETSFWTCPTCYDPIVEKKGRQYCKKCKKFL